MIILDYKKSIQGLLQTLNLAKMLAENTPGIDAKIFNSRIDELIKSIEKPTVEISLDSMFRVKENGKVFTFSQLAEFLDLGLQETYDILRGVEKNYTRWTFEIV